MSRYAVNVLQPIYYALETIFQQVFSKVDQQTKLTSSQTKISKQLFRMNRLYSFNRFQFYDHFLPHYQISPEALLEYQPSECYRNW